MQNYIWNSHIWNLNFANNLDGETTKMKVVVLEKLCSFVVNNFFIWNHLSIKIMFEVSTFEIQIFQMTSIEKWLKWKLYISKSYTTLKLTTFLFEFI
jgi:hypothetical protein